MCIHVLIHSFLLATVPLVLSASTRPCVDVANDYSLYVGGDFTIAGGVSANYVARWDSWTGSWSPLAGGTSSGPVDALTAFDDGTGEALYVGGNFTHADGIQVNYVARWDPGTETWSSVGSGFNDQVYCLGVHDDGGGKALYAGGYFSAASGGSPPLRGIARWNPANQSWQPVGPGFDRYVDALLSVDEGGVAYLYAAGGFTCTYGGATCSSGIMRWDGTSWSGVGPGINAGVNHDAFALCAVDDGAGEDLFLGGGFTGTRDGTPGTSYLAKWDVQDRIWSSLGGGMNEFVFALAARNDVDGPQLYAGGVFSYAGGISAQHIAEWDIQDQTWSALGSGTTDRVEALFVYDFGTGADLFVGGPFSMAGGYPSNYIARWRASDPTPDWDPLFGVPGMNNKVRAFAAMPNRVFDPPVITAVDPFKGSDCGGTRVTITGENFCSPCTVTFGGTEAFSVTVVDRETLQAIAPAGWGIVDVTVDTGIPPPATLFGAFEYRSHMPRIDSISPAKGPLNGGTAVRILGANFCLGARVMFGDEASYSVTLVTDSELLALSPPQLSGCLKPTVVPVTVINTDGASAILDPGFSYEYTRILQVGLGGSYSSIQAAIDAAVDGDAILIAGGFYAGGINTLGKKILLASLDPIDIATIVAPVGGRAITINSQEDRSTVIACLELTSGGGGLLIDAGSSPSIFNNQIHDGVATDDGGGILVSGGSSPLIRDNSIIFNSTTRNGGGVAIRGAGSAAVVRGNKIRINSAAGDGGGIAVLGSGSAARLFANDVSANTASGNGGGISLGTNTKVTMVRGHNAAKLGRNRGIRNNKALGNGGGIYCGADLDSDTGARVLRQIVSNDIFDNEAKGMGGGIFIEGGTKALVEGNMILDNNRTDEDPPVFHGSGGGIACDGSLNPGTDLTIRENTIEGNRADKKGAFGGGIYIKGSNNVFVAALIEGNHVCENVSEAGAGITLHTKIRPAMILRNVVAFNQVQGEDDAYAPGILEIDSALVLENNTLHENRGGNRAEFGGGLHGHAGLFSNPRIANNIFTSNDGFGVYLFNPVVDVPLLYNCFMFNALGTCGGDADGFCGAGNANIEADPEYYDASSCNTLSLRAGSSPCIDAGDPNSNSPCDGRIDMGAFESCPPQDFEKSFPLTSVR